MSSQSIAPIVRRADEIEYETVAAADGLSKGELLTADDGAPNFSLRRFTLDPGATVPKHVNAVEHEQYVLSGTYTIGIEDEEYTVTVGDSILVPAGTVHWYRNDSGDPGAFICAVPNGDDEIRLVDE